MNIERCEQLLEFCSTLPVKHEPFPSGRFFDMSSWFHHHECGTSGCLAGWSIAMFGNEAQKWALANPAESDEPEWEEEAALLLGLPLAIAEQLFHIKDETRALERLRSLIGQYARVAGKRE
ncbi:MAG: hypothetical protein OXH70_17465 [Acidobacteria bacterium]|nr:hypothetical protein [Acidobacteriota bacterium]